MENGTCFQAESDPLKMLTDLFRRTLKVKTRARSLNDRTSYLNLQGEKSLVFEAANIFLFIDDNPFPIRTPESKSDLRVKNLKLPTIINFN